jgi:hypothetical protein
VLALVASCDAVFGLRDVDAVGDGGGGDGPAANSHAFVQGASAQSESDTTTMLQIHLDARPEVGDLIVVAVSSYLTTLPPPFDSASNHYDTIVPQMTTGSNDPTALTMFAATHIVTSDNFTVTLIPDNDKGFVTAAVLEYATSGALSVATPTAGDAGPPTCGPISTETPELAIAALDLDGSGDIGSGTGFTQRESPSTNFNENPVLVTEDAPAGATTTTATFTSDAAGPWVCGLAIFQ